MAKKFSALQILHTFRDTRTGSKFLIDDATFYSVSQYTFEQCANGNIAEIVFKDNGNMPASNDANGTPRPETKATVIEEVILTDLGKRVTNLRDLKVQVEEKKLTKELKSLEV